MGNEMLHLDTRISFSFSARCMGLRRLYLFFTCMNRQLDNKQPLCQTVRYKHTKLHKQNWLPFRLIHILNEGHVQTRPGVRQVCTVPAIWNWLMLSSFNFDSYLPVGSFKNNLKTRLINSRTITKISTSQELLGCPLESLHGYARSQSDLICSGTQIMSVNEIRRSRYKFARLLLRRVCFPGQWSILEIWL